MTFLSSLVIGRGSAAPPVDVALITDAFLSSFVVGPRQPNTGVLECQDIHPIRAGAPKNASSIGATLPGRRASDAWEFRISQQKFKVFRKNNRKFPAYYRIFRK
ncbi:MAG: hypothetical protein ING00_12935 [Roseomonas sp.]|nr:hypothetical protein [Roseomonas sp.]